MAIQIISGTNRPGNVSILLAKTYQTALAERGTSSELINLEDLPTDLLSSDLYGKRSAAFLPFQESIQQHQHFIFIVPEYNGSIPGILKLFIDACDYPATFQGKNAWLVGLGAGERGNMAGLSHLRDILEFLGTKVYPRQVTIGKIRECMDKSGNLLEEGLPEEVNAQLAEISAILVSS